MKNYCIEMSDAYNDKNIVGFSSEIEFIDCKDVEGTRCYLDDDAKLEISKRLESVDVNALHFIDSGNYHYLSLLMLYKITQDFDLVLIDNHPDMKAASFGNITSCGGWVLEAIESLSHLKHIYMFGVKADLIEELLPLPDKVILNGDIANSDLSVYYSIDKDAFSSDIAVTDWDQGSMTYLEFDSIISSFKQRPIIGVDICGDTSEPDVRSNSINRASNQYFFDKFNEFL